MLYWPLGPHTLAASYHLAVSSVHLAASPQPLNTQFSVLFYSLSHSPGDFSCLWPCTALVCWGLPNCHPQLSPLFCTLAHIPESSSFTSPLDASQPLLIQNAWSSPHDSTKGLPFTVKSFSILPGAPAKGHSAVLDAFPSPIPRLLTVYRTSHLLTSNCNQNQTLPQCLQYTALPVSFKGKAKVLELSTGPYHAFSLWPLLLLVFSHTGLQPHWPPGCSWSTKGTSHPRILALAIPTCFRTLFRCYLLSEARLAVLLKSKLQVPRPTLPVPYWQCFFTGLTYNNVTSMRVSVFFLFCSLCIPKAYNSFWVYSRHLINISWMSKWTHTLHLKLNKGNNRLRILTRMCWPSSTTKAILPRNPEFHCYRNISIYLKESVIISFLPLEYPDLHTLAALLS